MTNFQTKGPVWGALGVLLFAGVMQLLRLLQLPDTLFGIVLRTAIQVVAIYAIISLCIARLPARRFLLIGVPLVFLGNVAWPPYYRSLEGEGQGVAQLVSAMVVGIGLGGIGVVWLMQHRRHAEGSK